MPASGNCTLTTQQHEASRYELPRKLRNTPKLAKILEEQLGMCLSGRTMESSGVLETCMVSIWIVVAWIYPWAKID